MTAGTRAEEAHTTAQGTLAVRDEALVDGCHVVALGPRGLGRAEAAGDAVNLEELINAYSAYEGYSLADSGSEVASAHGSLGLGSMATERAEERREGSQGGA